VPNPQFPTADAGVQPADVTPADKFNHAAQRVATNLQKIEFALCFRDGRGQGGTPASAGDIELRSQPGQLLLLGFYLLVRLRNHRYQRLIAAGAGAARRQFCACVPFRTEQLSVRAGEIEGEPHHLVSQLPILIEEDHALGSVAISCSVVSWRYQTIV
jgi:hypothetical protein